MPYKKRKTASTGGPKKYMLLILGMHRSGASVLGGVLSRLGCALSASHVPADTNGEETSAQSNSVFSFHDELFAQTGTTWRDWSQFDISWLNSPNGEAFRQAGRDFLNKDFGDEPLFALTDPRICRLVPFWKNLAAEENTKLLSVLLYRNPLEIAQSLEHKDGIDLPESLMIWLRYVLDAEISTRGEPRIITNYDKLMANWPAEIIRLQDTLGIILPRSLDYASGDIEALLSEDLRHFKEASDRDTDRPILPAWIGDVDEIFRRWSATGEDKADYAKLDHIRDGLNTVEPLFSHLVGSASKTARRLEDDGAALRSQNSTLQTEHDTLKAKLAQFDGAHADLVQIEGQLGTALADLEETRNRLAQTESALAQRRLEAEQTAKEADTLRIERDSAHARVTDLEANETMQARALSELRQQLRDHSDEIVTLEEQRMVQADELSRLSVLLKEAETATNERVEELEQSTQLLSEHGERIAEQDAQLAQIQSERGDLHAHVQFLEDELTAMRSSTLWRMTGPLRAAVNMLRGRR